VQSRDRRLIGMLARVRHGIEVERERRARHRHGTASKRHGNGGREGGTGATAEGSRRPGRTVAGRATHFSA